MNRLIVFVFFVILNLPELSADEGMWPVSQIDKRLYKQMVESGLELPFEALYNDQKACIKDAVVLFDGGCSAGVVSKNGLLFTNHHCARDRAQQVSTPEHNYVQNGYWANSLGEEIPIKGLNVKSLIKSENVTEKAKELLKSNSTRKVQAIIEKEYNDPEQSIEASLDGYSTGQYIVSVYRVFNDVRLVGIPPESIGNFGGETDNFVWPRQSADFAVFRIYADAGNHPAKYAADNKPYLSENSLPISLDGVHDNDFAMTYGFPFITQRNISSFELDEEVNVRNRATMITKGKYIEVLKPEMESKDDIRLKYSTKNFSAGNSQKLASGIVKYVSLSPAFEQKKLKEEEFSQWINQSSDRKAKYGEVLDVLNHNYNEQRSPKYAHSIITGALFGDACLFGIRGRQVVESAKKDSLRSKSLDNFKKWHTAFLKDYDAQTDKKVVKAMLELVKEQIEGKYLPDLYKTIDEKFNGNIHAYAENLYATSVFLDSAKVQSFLSGENLNVQDDPLYQFGIAIYQKMMDLKKLTNDSGSEIRNAKKLYAEGFREKNSGILSYPDANFSMRLTFGKVTGAEPRDGLIYKSQTTLKGILEKENSQDYQFYVWPRLKELYKNKDYGRYGENGQLYTCFLANTDITGGNSGSPVIDAKGRLIGLAFDGNEESLAGSIIYEKDKNRSINVDIRYVLFVIDKYAGNQYILKELNITK